MTKKILVTGGLGFIGSHLVDRLVSLGHDVRVLDNLEQQVHHGNMPAHASKEADIIIGDIRDEETVKNALEDVEVVFHEAAAVGVGQSMYQITKYVDVNTLGTAKLLDAIVNGKYGVRKMIVASSMSIYGEGLYKCGNCGPVTAVRNAEDLKKHKWEPFCSCGRLVEPLPTPETKKLDSESVYAISKKDQEELFLSVGKAYGIPAVALRYFNVYGPRQSLNNPYTGVCAIFSSMLKNNNSPVIFEDGQQTRDFVSVHDIVSANILAMDSKKADYDVFNVGNGHPVSILQIAETLAKLYNVRTSPSIKNTFRKGDIRHCYADISKIRKIGFEPSMKFGDGMKELVAWAKNENAVDASESAMMELKAKGL